MTPVEAVRIRPLVRPEAVLELAPVRGPMPRMAPRLLLAVHQGVPRVGPVLVDAVLLGGIAAATAGPVPLVRAAVALAGLILSGRVYCDRDRVLARGFGWWPGALAGPLAVATLLGAAVTGQAGTAAVTQYLGSLAALVLVRALAWCVISNLRRHGRDLAPCLVIGAGDRAATLQRTLERHPQFGLVVTAQVGTGALTDPPTLAEVVLAHAARHVILVADAVDGAGLPPLALRRSLGVAAHVSFVPAVSDALLEARTGHRIGGVVVLPLGRPLLGPGPRPSKRAFDLVGSSLLLLLSAPLLAVACAAIWLSDRGPVLFRQGRTGRGGQHFDIVKLRTMRPGAHDEQARLTAYNTSDGLLFKMTADPRVTRVGKLLRRTGIDELPQLLNVLRGQMSLIGPRPLPVESAAFSQRDNERHLVRPGLTGLWQVSGGSSLRYREMVDLDLAYVHGWSMTLDLSILLATAGVLLRATFGHEGRDR